MRRRAQNEGRMERKGRAASLNSSDHDTACQLKDQEAPPRALAEGRKEESVTVLEL